ncbi:MAG: TRAP transporter substrate-binding protein [Candidatus Accumulibacter sp.]|jgi:tripartite ATP-independent transporter DctP family solute receptor|nr:TRAP transporter substrate-binding protein [Accumulibacter sp.]
MKAATRAIIASLLALVFVVPAVGQAQEKKQVRIHTAGPADPNVDQTALAMKFADYVNANSKTVEVKVFPNSQLGQSREVIEAMRLGSGASATTGGPGEYLSFVKRLGVLGLPFVWKDYNHAIKVLNGEVGAELNGDMEKAGFKVLAWSVSWGFRSVVTAKKEVTKVEDLKGLKIRTIPNKVFLAVINTLGANATPMNFGEVYTSLQSGVLDGYEHTPATTASFKFYEVACCTALTRHLMDPTMLAFSLPEWKKFNAEEQDVMLKGAKAAATYVLEQAPQKENEFIELLKKNGMKFHEIDLSSLKDAVAKAQDDLAKETGTESLLAKIRAVQ